MSDNNVINLRDFAKKPKMQAGSVREEAVRKMSLDLIDLIESKLSYDTVDLRNTARLNIAAMLMAQLVFEMVDNPHDVSDEKIAEVVHRVSNIALRELYKIKAKHAPTGGPDKEGA